LAQIESNVESKKGPKGLTVEINGDTSGLNAALDESTAKAERLVSLLKEANGLIHSFKAID
jgi:phage-related minor tail protein